MRYTFTAKLGAHFSGLVYKKGKFSAIEIKQINDAIENYRTVRFPSYGFFCPEQFSSRKGVCPRRM
jgi:hypothetical protein